MNNQTSIEKLITSGKSVFTTSDLAVIWQISDRKKLTSRIKYYLKFNRLEHIHKGVYAYGEYTQLDIAQKLVPLSYISLYTTAQMHGLTFQHYSTIYCVSMASKKYNIGTQKYEYHKVKESIFYSDIGLINNGRYTYANKERTICDLLYVYPRIAIDNIQDIDSNLLRRISQTYNNKRLQRDINLIVKQIKREVI